MEEEKENFATKKATKILIASSNPRSGSSYLADILTPSEVRPFYAFEPIRWLNDKIEEEKSKKPKKKKTSLTGNKDIRWVKPIKKNKGLKERLKDIAQKDKLAAMIEEEEKVKMSTSDPISKPKNKARGMAFSNF